MVIKGGKCVPTSSSSKTFHSMTSLVAIMEQAFSLSFFLPEGRSEHKKWDCRLNSKYHEWD
jgi:hypothetical protein